MAEKKKPQTPWFSASKLNSIKMGSTMDTKKGFKIRRVPGGYMYEYENGNVAFVSNDELQNE